MKKNKKELLETVRKNSYIIFCFIFLVCFSKVYSQEIHQAVDDGNIKKVEALLNENPILINKEDVKGCTPLFNAVLQKNVDMAKLLIDKGALLRVGDYNLRSPIHYAGFMNDTVMINLLLKKGALVDTRAIGGASPLIHSSLHNRYELSKFLIEHGADINIQCNSLTVPLYFAVLNNNMEYVNYLIQSGADIDMPDFLNRTPLYIAVRDGYSNIAEVLINNGADFKRKENYLNRNLLHLAAVQGHTQMCELLIKKGIPMNEKDSNGNTPLDYANRYAHKYTAKFLIENGGKSYNYHKITSLNSIVKGHMSLGDAVVIKLQNGSWGILTQNHFLIFAYSEIGNYPLDKSIVNGYLVPNEIINVPWIYFDMSFHPEDAVFSLQGKNPVYYYSNKTNTISFVLNKDFERNYSSLNLSNSYFPEIQKKLNIDDLQVTVIPSYKNKKGYFIECDKLKIFWLSEITEDYNSTVKDLKIIDYVKDNLSNIDILLLGTPDGIGPEKGNGIRETYLEAVRFNPKTVIFMGKEPLERKILYQIGRRIHVPDNLYQAENPGDYLIIKN